ncbi:MAG: hypothetical protein DMG14_17585, partial [Acidobacteria bacterium]
MNIGLRGALYWRKIAEKEEHEMKPAVFFVAITLLAAAVPLMAGQAPPPRTPWGHPDLQGIWDNHSITPLERPAKFAGRQFLTPQEVAELEKKAVEE